ncbi:hypothetical protein BH09ACT6_BH09ACT6_05440 [soil metagenome]
MSADHTATRSTIPATGSRIRTDGLDSLFNARSIAVVGASSDPTKIGGRPLRYLKERGYTGAIYPVNPHRDEVQGEKAYRTIEDLPQGIDLALIALASMDVPAAVEACGRQGVKVATVFSAGFAEIGDEGAALQRQVVEAAERHGMRLLGPNCIGSMNRRSGTIGTFAAAAGAAKPRVVGETIALISQSGAIAAHWVVQAAQVGIEFDPWLSTGNEGDIDLADCLAYLATDPDVRLIAVYLEGSRDGQKLREALTLAQELGKPVVILKAGSSSVGARAVASHTASLAGSDEVFDALCAQVGAIRAGSMGELFDICYAFAVGRRPTGNKVGVLTGSGGVGILMADAAEKVGLDVAPLPEHAQAELKRMWPPAGVVNPIDLTAQLMNGPAFLRDFSDVVIRDGNYDLIVFNLGYMGLLEPWSHHVVEALDELRERYPEMPMFAAIMATPEVRARLEQLGVTVFDDPSTAVRVAGVVARASRSVEVAVRSERPPNPETRPLGDVSTEVAALAALAAFGIPVVDSRIASTREAAAEIAADLGQNVAMKVVSAQVPHKSDVGGVVLNVASPREASEAFDAIMASVHSSVPAATIDGILVAPMISGGVETFIGATIDPAFGPVVLFGLGGVFVELLKDVSYRLAPFGLEVAEQMIREVRGFALLDGARGGVPADLQALSQALSDFSYFVAEHADEIASVDINPFVVLQRGKGALALDALITMKNSLSTEDDATVDDIPVAAGGEGHSMKLDGDAATLVAAVGDSLNLPARVRENIRVQEAFLAQLRSSLDGKPSSPEPVVRVEEIAIDGGIPARIYVPDGDGPLPIVVYFHGGGWVAGGLNMHDETCRRLANRVGGVVVNVDYRLAPEHPYPAALDDASAALIWASRNAGTYGADGSRLIAVGSSAGGNLVAAAVLRARDAGAPEVALQVLVYPVLDAAMDTASYDENSDGYILSRDLMQWYWDLYVPDATRRLEPGASPLRAGTFEGLPPTMIVTAGFDPLRDEAERYATLLRAADVLVDQTNYAGQIHGFMGYFGAVAEADTALDALATAIRNRIGFGN